MMRVARQPLSQQALSQSCIDEMKIKYFLIREKPSEGYPLYICLHGGGGTHPSA